MTQINLTEQEQLIESLEALQYFYDLHRISNEYLSFAMPSNYLEKEDFEDYLKVYFMGDYKDNNNGCKGEKVRLVAEQSLKAFKRIQNVKVMERYVFIRIDTIEDNLEYLIAYVKRDFEEFTRRFPEINLDAIDLEILEVGLIAEHMKNIW